MTRLLCYVRYGYALVFSVQGIQLAFVMLIVTVLSPWLGLWFFGFFLFGCVLHAIEPLRYDEPWRELEREKQ